MARRRTKKEVSEPESVEPLKAVVITSEASSDVQVEAKTEPAPAFAPPIEEKAKEPEPPEELIAPPVEPAPEPKGWVVKVAGAIVVRGLRSRMGAIRAASSYLPKFEGQVQIEEIG